MTTTTTYEATSPTTGKVFARKSGRNEYKFAVVITVPPIAGHHKFADGAEMVSFFSEKRDAIAFSAGRKEQTVIVEAVAR